MAPASPMLWSSRLWTATVALGVLMAMSTCARLIDLPPIWAHRRLTARRIDRENTLLPVAPEFSGVRHRVFDIAIDEGMVRISYHFGPHGNTTLLKPWQFPCLRHDNH